MKKERRRGSIRRRLIAGAAACAVMLSLFDPFALAVHAAGGDVSGGARNGQWEGQGTETDPWLIEDLEDLEALAASVNSGEHYEDNYFRMTADIDMSSKYSEAAGISWPVIGTGSTDNGWNWFGGTFDGGGHEIQGLYIKVEKETGVNGPVLALFGSIQGSTIKNLGVGGKVEYIVATPAEPLSAAGLVGSASEGSRIESCHNSCEITGDSKGLGNGVSWQTIGGLVARGSGITITGCSNTGRIHNNNSSGKCAVIAGGIIGEIDRSEIIDCHNEGSVSFYINGYEDKVGQNIFRYVGGIVGELNSCTVSRCSNKGPVNGTTSGGICGLFGGASLSSPTVRNSIELSYNTGNIAAYERTGQVARAGGVCGSSQGASMGMENLIRNCYNTGNIRVGTYSTAYAGGVCGNYTSPFVMESCFNAGNLPEDRNVKKGELCGGTSYSSTEFTKLNCPIYSMDFRNKNGGWTYMLQGEQEELIWGQTLKGDNPDEYPVFIFDLSEEEKNAKRVYRVQFYQNGELARNGVHYGNTTGVNDLGHKNGYEGYWSLRDGTEFTVDTELTSDLKVYFYLTSDRTAVNVLKEKIQSTLQDLQITNNTTSRDIQKAIEEVMKDFYLGGESVAELEGVKKTKATQLEEGSIAVTVSIRRGETADSLELDLPIARLPMSDEEKLAYIKDIVKSEFDGVSYRNLSSSFIIRTTIEKALENARVDTSDVKVTPGTPITAESGEITLEISITAGSAGDSITISREPIPTADQFRTRLDELRRAVEEALQGFRATNDTVGDYVPLVRAAVRQVISDPCFMVKFGPRNMHSANKEQAGHADIEYYFEYNLYPDSSHSAPEWVLKDGEDGKNFQYSIVIPKLPTTDAEKMEAALPTVQEALDQISASNETDRDSIQSAVDSALEDAGLGGVKAEVGPLFKIEATSDTPGNIGGEIRLICGEETDTIPVDLSIEKLPKIEEEKKAEEKVEEAKKVVENVLENLVITNNTTKEDIQEAIDKALEDAGVREDVTAAVGNLAKTEATDEADGSITGEVIIESDSKPEASDSIVIDKPIDKLPVTDEEKVQAVRKVAEAVVKDLKADNDTAKENIQDVIDQALREAGISDVTVTVGDLTIEQADKDSEGHIGGQITIVSANDGTKTDTIEIDKTISRLPKTEEDLAEEKEQAAKARDIVKGVLAGLTVTNDDEAGTVQSNLQGAVDQALEDAGVSGVTAEVGELTKTDATSKADGSLQGGVTITCGDAQEAVVINKIIAKLPKTEEEKEAEKRQAAEAGKIAAEALADKTFENTHTVGADDIKSIIEAALEEAGISDVTVEVKDLNVKRPTAKEAGSVSGKIVVTCGDATDEKAFENELPGTEDQQTLRKAIPVLKKAWEELQIKKGATEEDIVAQIKEAMNTALKGAGLGNVEIQQCRISLYEDTFSLDQLEAGIPGSEVNPLYLYSYDGFERKRLVETGGDTEADQAKVQEARTAVENALRDLAVTNGTTKESIQEEINQAISDAGITGVTVTVGEIAKTEATKETDGSITGTVTIISGETQGTVSIEKIIEKLSETGGDTEADQAKVAEAKQAVRDVWDRIQVSNDTTEEAVLNEMNAALGAAGLGDVSLSLTLSKSDADTETEGRVGGSVSITAGSASETIVLRNKRIEKLPKTDAEKVEEARKEVETALENLVMTNQTTQESIQAAVEKALEEAGISDVTVTVGEITKTEATEETAGSISGEITIVSKNDGSVTDSVTIESPIDKLPVSDEEKVAAAKKIAETVVKGIKATNDTSQDSIKSAIDAILSEAGVQDVTVTVNDFAKTDATSNEEGSITGTITITSTNNDTLLDSVPISKVIDKLPKTDEEIRQEEAKKVEEAKQTVEETLKGITLDNDASEGSIREQIEKVLSDAGITDVTVAVDELVKTEATKDTAGSITGTIIIICGDTEESLPIEIKIEKLPKTDADKAEEAKAAAETALDKLVVTNGTTKENIQAVVEKALEEAGVGDVTVTVEDFQKTEATTKAEGSITGNVVIQSGTIKDIVAINVTIPRLPGKVDKEVNTDGSAPSMQIATSEDRLKDMLLEEAEKQLLAEGTDVRIILDVKDASGSADSADKALVEEALSNAAEMKGFAAGQYLDISLYKVIGESMKQPISKTREKITITIDVPDSLKITDSSITRIYAVIRVHDGVAELLSDLDHNVDTITIETDSFSTYAIIYKDTSSIGNDENGDNDDNQGGNDEDGGNHADASGQGGQMMSPPTDGTNTVSGWMLLAMIGAFGALTAAEKLHGSKKHGRTLK